LLAAYHDVRRRFVKRFARDFGFWKEKLARRGR
jgi:hypothetical protein